MQNTHNQAPMQRPAQTAPAAAPAPVPEAPPKPRIVEMELHRKYCPFDLVGEDGTVTPNGDSETGIMKNMQPGLVRMTARDANRALRAGIALPPDNVEVV